VSRTRLVVWRETDGPHQTRAEAAAVELFDDGLRATGTMACVDVPSLTVHESEQRYEHLAPGIVRYVDRGRFEGFTAELELDPDGLVLRYPGLAERAG
jgi:hypothetical protein